MPTSHEIRVHRTVRTTVHPSERVLQVAAMFGLGLDEHKQIDVVPATTLMLHPHQLLFLTGPSGSGKSTLLRLLAQRGREELNLPVIDFGGLDDPPDRPLVDALGDRPLDQTLRLLSLAGLNDAFVMLRTPAELSDGQRYRFRLAQAMAEVQDGLEQSAPSNSSSSAQPELRALLIADEFGAALDRITAATLARNLRKFVDRLPLIAAVATTHDDLLEPLQPDVLVHQQLGGTMEVLRRAHEPEGR